MFFDLYGLETINLRYFNIFGPRQNPFGAYAAVIPQWIDKCLRGEACTIHGSAEISRDFCPVANVVQANIVAATTRNRKALSAAYNVASGSETTLGRLYELVSEAVSEIANVPVREVEVGPAREDDLQHSAADIGRIKADLGFTPVVEMDGALRETVSWYANRAKKR
jgi:UDP-N-acetylglucosamine 4-epimerase